MANKRNNPTTPKTRRQARSHAQVRVIEAGSDEQEGDRSSPVVTHAKKEREEYRHGGTPLGSDPRE